MYNSNLSFSRRTILFLLLSFFLSCKPHFANNKIEHTPWSKSATIYEVNVRQFTPEGTLKAFAEYLPKIKDMGIDISGSCQFIQLE